MHARLFRTAHHRADAVRAVGQPRQHRHEQDTGRQTRLGQPRERLQPCRGQRRVRLEPARQRIVCGGDGQLAQHGRVLLYRAQNVNIAADEAAFRDDRHAEAVFRKQRECAACQPLGALVRIIRIAHRAGADNAGVLLAAQLVPQQQERVLLGVNMVEIVVAVALRAAVAVNAAVRAAAVQIHVPVRAEPVLRAFLPCQQRFCGDGVHGRTLPFVVFSIIPFFTLLCYTGNRKGGVPP